MFGYITLSRINADKEMRLDYRAYYCGLCHVLSSKYGIKGIHSLSFDMVFLTILLADIYNEKPIKGKERCIVRPLFPHNYTYAGSATDYAADMQMLLFYFSLLDNIADEHKDIGKARKYEHIAIELSEKYPRQYAVLKSNLDELRQREERNEKNPEALSLLFGKILGEIFVMDPEFHFSPELRALGEALGRFVYLIDGWDDRKKDKRKGCFNPYPDNIGEKDAEKLLLNAAADASIVFERLPLDDSVPIMRNIIYSGIWSRFKKESR